MNEELTKFEFSFKVNKKNCFILYITMLSILLK